MSSFLGLVVQPHDRAFPGQCARSWGGRAEIEFFFRLLAYLAVLVLTTVPSAARGKDGVAYGEGLIINIPYPEPQVEKVVEDVVQNGIIRGTKEYNKDQYISGAVPEPASKALPEWTGPGKIFYKVKFKALDPRNFKDSGDVGTLTVRYIVQPQGETNTVLRIDAIFVEDFRRSSHPSSGSVEGAEYKDIHDRLESMQIMAEQAAEAVREKQASLAQEQTQNFQNAVDSGAQSNSALQPTPSTDPQSSPTASDSDQGQTLEQRVKGLRDQVERVVKAPGAPLKTAPFHTASTLQLLNPGTEVLIVISTPYWYGVETRDGQHGWIPRDELEAVQ